MPVIQMTYNGGAAAYAANLHDKLSKIVKKSTNDLLAEAISEIQTGDKSGTVYVRGGVEHQASAPEEAPATDTGNLIASMIVRENSPLSSSVVVGADYGLYLETGTARMSPRPFMSPALVEIEPGFIAACENAVATS